MVMKDKLRKHHKSAFAIKSKKFLATSMISLAVVSSIIIPSFIAISLTNSSLNEVNNNVSAEEDIEIEKENLLNY